MAEEIVTLRVNIQGATEAQIGRLERLDQVLAALQRRGSITLNIGGINLADAERAANAAVREIAARERSMRQETQHLIQVQRIRDFIAQAERRRQQEADQQLRQEQERIQQGFQIMGSYLYRALVQNVQKAARELKAMNAEMVSIQKVTGATGAEMERLKNSAFEVAGDLGALPTD